MVVQLEGQLRDLKSKKESAETKADIYEENIKAYQDALKFAVDAAGQLVESSKAKKKSKEQLRSAYVAKELQAKLNYDRHYALLQIEVKSPKEVEKLKKEWDVAKAEIESLDTEILGLENEVQAKEKELKEKQATAQTKIESARAMKEDAMISVATTDKDIKEIEMKLGEMKRRVIKAPRDGKIYRMPIYERGQMIKAGDKILTLVPDISKQAVQLMIRGNDMPLIQVGQEVRLQFEGWPAVQFSGWPSIAIGSFSGLVQTVDATDDGKGQFRVLVVPNPDAPDEWPDGRYLRPGVRANAWVLLKQVTLGYELWRQLNGFPVMLYDEEPKKDKTKPPKLPK